MRHSHVVPITAASKRRGRQTFILPTTRTEESQGAIHYVMEQFQELNIHMPDPEALYVTLGAMAGNMMSGKPVWLLLVGASGSGKTLLLESLMKLDRTRMVASIKGESALLSGVKKKDRAHDATGGILKELGENGCLVFMDLNTLLSKRKEEVGEMLGILRELYDRTWSRDIGGEGGRHIAHSGRVCLLAGVTHTIDRHTEANQEMGPRCLFYRLPWTDGYQESMSAVNAINPDETRTNMQLIVQAMFNGLELSFENPTLRREMNPTEADVIVGIAQLGSKLRSIVPRDWKDRTVIDVPSEEVSTRMSQQMSQLFCGMEAIGVHKEQIWAALRKIAMDSMPQVRRMTLKCIIREDVKLDKGISTGAAKVVDIAKQIRISETAAKRVVEDLSLLGVIKKKSEGWRLTEWSKERLGIEKPELKREEE